MYASALCQVALTKIYRCLYYYNGMATKFAAQTEVRFSKLSEEEITALKNVA